MQRPVLAGCAVVCACCPSVFGQAFNIDLGGFVNTAPSSDYGSAAGQAGYWNYHIQNDDKLRDLSGSLTSVKLVVSNGVGSENIPGVTGNDERFMESFVGVTPTNDFVSLFGLAPGLYDCYVYSWMGPVFGNATVQFTLQAKASTATGQVTYGPVWPGGQVEGVTYDRIRIEVPANAVALDVRVGMDNDFQILNGLQIVPVPAPASGLALVGLPLILIRRRR